MDENKETTRAKNLQRYPDIAKEIYYWLDASERINIARDCGIISQKQVWNVCKGYCKNHTLRRKLVEGAEKNKAISDQAKRLNMTQSFG